MHGSLGIGAAGAVLRLDGQHAAAAVERALQSGAGEVLIAGPGAARLCVLAHPHRAFVMLLRDCVRAFLRDGGASAAVAWVE